MKKYYSIDELMNSHASNHPKRHVASALEDGGCIQWKFMSCYEIGATYRSKFIWRDEKSDFALQYTCEESPKGFFSHTCQCPSDSRECDIKEYYQML